MEWYEIAIMVGTTRPQDADEIADAIREAVEDTTARLGGERTDVSVQAMLLAPDAKLRVVG